MKFNLKTLAIAAALVAAGSANAAFTSGGLSGTTGNSTLGLFAWDTVTKSFYLRDLGYTMNTFLPDSGASITPTGELTPVFDKTPEAGLSFTNSDASFSSWLSTVTPGNVRWLVAASDSLGTGTTNRVRQIGSISTTATFVTPSNAALGNGTAGINQFANATPGISTTGSLSVTQNTNLGGSFLGQGSAGSLAATLGGTANLYYWTRSANSGTSATAFQQSFANSANTAVLSLASNGDFSYALAPVSAVPLPAAAWLMGAGLVGLGGMVRRRKAAAAQV
jgi:hypothetical protein